MFVTNCISTTKIQKISEITNFFRHYFLSRTEVIYRLNDRFLQVVLVRQYWYVLVFCRRIAVHLPPEFRTDMV